MFLLRKIGAVLRGKATRPQILIAVLLGACLGFVPGSFLPQDLGGGFMQAPGLIVSLVCLALILNANLALFGLATVCAKLLSLPLLPVSVAAGRMLLEGPAEGLFRWLVNAPVFAWFGFERYATTGGLALAIPIGLLGGWLVWRGLHRLRTGLADAEEGSERFQKLSSKGSVKVLAWVFLGKSKGKQSWRELSERDSKGLPIRITGVVVAVVLVGVLWLANSVLGEAWFRSAAQTGLTHWNGATVDVGGAQLDLAGGRLVFEGLAMADVEQLDRDSFRAGALDLDVSTTELLAGRVVVDRIASRDALSGAERDKPGEKVIPDDPSEPVPPDGEGGTLEDYLAEAELWKQRLEQAQEWLERLSGNGGDEPLAGETPEERDARIAREQEVLGLVGLVAHHLVAGRPAVTVRELELQGVKALQIGGELIDVRGSNLSSHPDLGEQPLSLDVSSRSGSFALGFRYAPGSAAPEIDLRVPDLPMDTLLAAIPGLPLRGGKVSLRFAGALDAGHADGLWVDLPLTVDLEGTSIVIDGKPTALDPLSFPIGLKGPLTAPRIDVDTDAFTQALVAQGRRELADQVRSRADALLGGAVPGVGEQLGGLIDGSKEGEGVVDEAAKRAQEELEKRVPDALKGLFPGSKKKD